MLEKYGEWDSWKILFRYNDLRYELSIYPNIFEQRNYEEEGNINMYILLNNQSCIRRLLLIDHRGQQQQQQHHPPIKAHGLIKRGSLTNNAISFVESLISPNFCCRRPQRSITLQRLITPGSCYTQ